MLDYVLYLMPTNHQDELEKNIIPQVALFDLLKKFDGMTEKVTKIDVCVCVMPCFATVKPSLNPGMICI